MHVSKNEREICSRKRSYPTKNKARYWAGVSNKEHPDWDKLRAYHCPVCGKYHLTSEPLSFMKRLRWLRINGLWEEVKEEICQQK